MRLFVAVRPSVDVIDALDALARPDIAGVRWTTRDQWHVTLRFLGDVAVADPVIDPLRTAALLETTATIGPRAALLGRGVVQLPVHGLGELANAVVEATRSIGEPPPSRRFRGHLTLARTKGVRIEMSALALAGEWPVHEIELIRSHLGRGGARYETLEAIALRRV